MPSAIGTILCAMLMGSKKRNGLGSGAAVLAGMGRAPVGASVLAGMALAPAGASVLCLADGMWKAELQLQAPAEDVPVPESVAGSELEPATALVAGFLHLGLPVFEVGCLGL